jgi:hypothetical protein
MPVAGWPIATVSPAAATAWRDRNNRFHSNKDQETPMNMLSKPLEPYLATILSGQMGKHEISDALFNHAKQNLGEQQLVNLVAVSETYDTVAMLLSLGEESSPADKPLPFPEKGRRMFHTNTSKHRRQPS